MRGVNDDELVDFARLSLQRKLTVRFIEHMPLGDAELLHNDTRAVNESQIGPAGGCGAQDRGHDSLIPETEINELIHLEVGPLIPMETAHESGVGPATL